MLPPLVLAETMSLTERSPELLFLVLVETMSPGERSPELPSLVLIETMSPGEQSQVSRTISADPTLGLLPG